jgi:IS5 family transposase
MTRFRKRIGPSGAEELLKQLIETAKRKSILKKSHLNKVNVDTTVQEKAIAFPTDARLYYKMREALVRAAKERDIPLRQSYTRVAKAALAKQGRYAHAKQYRRSGKMTKKLKTYLGCVYRDIHRKEPHPDDELWMLLLRAMQILNQKKDSKDKIYSVHAPEVECVSKGKAHKRYEFGNKVGVATTSRDNWVVGIQAFHGNPYDGHTLTPTLEQVERLTDWQVKDVYVDQGYRGNGYQGDTQVNIVSPRKMKRATRSVKRWLKRRSAIEPVIGHIKSDNRMSKNFLKGKEGDQINALLSGCGFNMRKLLAVFFLPQNMWHFLRDLYTNISTKNQRLQLNFG